MRAPDSKFVRTFAYRPGLIPSPCVTLGARSTGHYVTFPGYRDRWEQKAFAEVFWSIRGSGKIAFGERVHNFGPACIAVYQPGDFHRLWNDGADVWEYYWWTMDGPLAQQIIAAFGLTTGTVHKAAPPPVQRFQELEAQLPKISLAEEMRASVMAYQLLSLAAHAIQARQQEVREALPTDAFKEEALGLLQQFWRDPAFSTDEMAAHFKMHRSRFSRRFSAAFGAPPSRYLTKLRIQQAITLLLETDDPIQEIALHCGWSDANYFTRCIRTTTGHSPQALRQRANLPTA